MLEKKRAGLEGGWVGKGGEKRTSVKLLFSARRDEITSRSPEAAVFAYKKELELSRKQKRGFDGRKRSEEER